MYRVWVNNGDKVVKSVGEIGTYKEAVALAHQLFKEMQCTSVWVLETVSDPSPQICYTLPRVRVAS